jgi:Na+-transporting methylmalonyl-CoA/oxaloacetate decarboxylase gamma subunit
MKYNFLGLLICKMVSQSKLKKKTKKDPPPKKKKENEKKNEKEHTFP